MTQNDEGLVPVIPPRLYSCIYGKALRHTEERFQLAWCSQGCKNFLLRRFFSHFLNHYLEALTNSSNLPGIYYFEWVNMATCIPFQTQLSSIMEVLVKAAVAEISKLVDDKCAFLHLEISRKQSENEMLKRKLLVMESKNAQLQRGFGKISITVCANWQLSVLCI